MTLGKMFVWPVVLVVWLALRMPASPWKAVTLRGRATWRSSWPAGRSGVPPVRGPGPTNQATHGDDRVGEVEERVDDQLATFVAALQPVERVFPGVCAFDVPPLTGLNRGLITFVCDLAGHAATGQLRAGLVRVIASVQVHDNAFW